MLEQRPLWESLVGKAPEEIEERPTQGIRNEVGPFADAHLFITQSTTRIDFTLGSLPTAERQSGFVHIGPYPNAKPPLVEIIRRWTATAPPVARIAFAPVLLLPVPDRETGYRILKDLLHFLQIDPKHSTDLLWQINRPRQSKVLQGLEINRLSNWSAMSVQTLRVSMGAGAPVASTVPAKGSAVRLGLDINTEARETALPSESLPAFVDELVSFADEIATRGDIA
jgi:hypothetical protein